jgi:uncharacterized membrane protein
MPIHLFWLFGIFFWMLVFVGLTFLLVWFAMRISRGSGPAPHTSPPSPSPGASDAPLDILARRFAKGEITADEYQKGRELLGGGGPPA